MPLSVGDLAPDFELRSHRGGAIRLSDFRRKKNVVIAFHPLAFTPVCANQMRAYESDLGRLDAADTTVLGISIDAQPAKAAWARTYQIPEQPDNAELLAAIDALTASESKK